MPVRKAIAAPLLLLALTQCRSIPQRPSLPEPWTWGWTDPQGVFQSELGKRLGLVGE